LAASFEHAIALAYPLPKVFYHRGQLLRRATYHRLAESSGMAELIRRLVALPFFRPVITDRFGVTARELEARLQRLVLSFCFKMAELTQTAMRDFLHAYLSRPAFTTLTALLKARLIPRIQAPPISDAEKHVWRSIGHTQLLNAVQRTRNVQELQHAVRGASAFRDLVEDAVSLYWRLGVTSMVDASAAKVYYAHVLDAMDRLSPPDRSDARRPIELEIDRYNAMAVIRGKSWGMTAPTIRAALIPHATRLTGKVLEQVMDSTIADALHVIVGVLLPERTPEVVTVPTLEMALKRLETRACWRMLMKTPFTAAQILAVIKLRLVENANLLAVIYGVESKMDADQILAHVVTVGADGSST
jgi:vacuolar-type H+-ATPase subunit C/Vma6